jgi:hypothetical protein
LGIFYKEEKTFFGNCKKELVNICGSLIFAQQFLNMAHEIEDYRDREFGYNWVTSSRFLFYMQVFVVVAFLLGGCFELYQHRYKGHPDVEVPGNTLYTPQYK